MDPRFIRSMLCIKLIGRNRRRIQTLAYIFRGDPQIHTGFLARPKRFFGIEAEKLYLVVVELHQDVLELDVRNVALGLR